MPRNTFSFGTANSHTMEVDYRWWGRETYFVDGELLESKWNLSFVGIREFHIGDHKVRIEVSCGTKEYFTRVFVDDQVHLEELFPDFKVNAAKWNTSLYSFMKNMGRILIVAVCIFFAVWFMDAQKQYLTEYPNLLDGLYHMLIGEDTR